MKYLVLLTIALVAVVAAAEEQPKINAAKIHEDCVEESHMTEQQVEAIRKRERPDEKEVHDYFLCSVKKYGVFTEDEGYSMDRYLELFRRFGISDDRARPILEKCIGSNEQNDTPAVRAYRGVICLVDNKIEELWKEVQDKIKAKESEA